MVTLLIAAGVSAATAGTIGTAMTAVSLLATVAGGVSSYVQGEAESDQLELQARMAEVNGRMEAIETNEELLRTISMNNASAAAGGIQSSGSVARASEEAQRQASRELNVNRFNADMQKSALLEKADQASRGGKMALAGSLFDAVGTAGSGFKKYKAGV